MATQENLAISSPSFAAEQAAFSRVVKKDSEKGKAEIVHLASVLASLEEDMASAKGGAKGEVQGGKNASSSSRPSFEQAMADMAFILQTLQVKIAKFSQKKAGYSEQIAQKQLAESREQLKELNQKIADIQKAQAKAKKWGIFKKVIEYLIVGLTAAIGAVTAQPELFVMSGVALSSATGLTKKATEGLAEGLKKMIPGMSDKLANILAGAVITLAVIALTAGTAGGASAAEEGAAGTAAKTSWKATKLSIANGMTAMSGTNLLQTALAPLSNAIAKSIVKTFGLSKDDEKLVAMITTSVLSVAVTALAGFAGYSALKNGAKAGARIGGDIAAKIVAASPRLYTLAAFAQLGGTGGQSGYQIYEGVLQKGLAEVNASLIGLRMAMSMNDTQTQENQKQDTATFKQQNTGTRSLGKLMAGESAFANLFVYNSPV